MGRNVRWIKGKYENGIITYTVSSWKYFHDFIQEQLLDFKTYVYRGQTHENWLLEPSVNRLIDKTMTKDDYNKTLTEHLENFKFSVRGRTHNLREILDDENELWALGQHNGLKTPLLDFTFSPYVAAYFAFIDKEDLSDHRVIWAASQFTVENQIKDQLNLFKPMSGHNTRLLHQSGLFIKFNVKDDMENIFKSSRKDKETEIQLFKILLPNKDRTICLRSLNRMNINHNTLFPDVYGASIYCNIHLEINKY